MAKEDVTQTTYTINQEGKERQSFTDAKAAGAAWFKADLNTKPMMLGACRDKPKIRTFVL
ncbi:hypothetical protein KVQ82_31060 (plasmid) [Pseudomonas sp. AO-1]|uniref:hypothetical protein n=1 Tax=Pseudomonas sp. AO-1 TaxID=2855434 RepID=UPI001C78B147|nr:hypothetical protein [Pseudomonas sp. AO-1]QXZ17518.1 hypothetical protein KVQ82_31060 [Pseudomonas sp. AO-1]